MERSDPVVFTVLQRRRAALMECDWDIRLTADARGQRSDGRGQLGEARGADEVLAAEQAACLREVYDGVENFREAVGFLFTGFCRGFAHLEKHWGRDGRIERLEPVEQWFWVRDGMFGPWQYNRDAVSSRIRGEAVNLDNFVILEAIPMNRILCLLYLRRVLGNRNWDSYLDVFGIPPVFLIGPPNAGTDKEQEYQIIAEQLFSNGRGYLPNGSDIKYVNAGGGRAPYREQLEYLDKQITLVGTGGLLTMLTEAGYRGATKCAPRSPLAPLARREILERGAGGSGSRGQRPRLQKCVRRGPAGKGLPAATVVARDWSGDMLKHDRLVTCLEAVVNTGWTNEARVVSLEVRRAKAAARAGQTGDADAVEDAESLEEKAVRKKQKPVLSPEQAAFEKKVRSELQAMKDAWAAYEQAKSDEEKAAAEAKYPWLAKLNLRLGGSKVRPPEFPPVVPSPGGNAQMYFDSLDAAAAAKKAKAAQEQERIEEKAMLDLIHWQSTQKAGLNIPLSAYQKAVAPAKEYSLVNDPYMTRAEKAAVRKMDKAREDAATEVRKAKDAARRAEAAVIYGKGDVTALQAAHAAAQAAVRETVEKQKKLGALSTVQPVEWD